MPYLLKKEPLQSFLKKPSQFRTPHCSFAFIFLCYPAYCIVVTCFDAKKNKIIIFSNVVSCMKLLKLHRIFLIAPSFNKENFSRFRFFRMNSIFSFPWVEWCFVRVSFAIRQCCYACWHQTRRQDSVRQEERGKRLEGSREIQQWTNNVSVFIASRAQLQKFRIWDSLICLQHFSLPAFLRFIWKGDWMRTVFHEHITTVNGLLACGLSV